MRAFDFVIAAGLLAAGCAHAQLLDTPAPRLEARPLSGALVIAPSSVESFYLRNEAHRPALPQPGWRSDPRFVVGVNLNRYLALEGGYLERFDRGYHKIDLFDPTDRDDMAGARGYHAYAGGKVTVPLTERLSASGTLGEAYSERRGGDMSRIRAQDVDVGVFTRVGAEYQPTANTSISGSAQNFGSSSAKFGKSGTNANGLKGMMGLKY
jgi:hypothetical protein